MSSLATGIDLDLLYPPFRDRLLEVISRLSVQGFDFKATLGYRTYGEQMALWAQGRTKPGPKVTNAKGGESQHNFGLAVDLVRLKKGKVSWDTKDYEPLEAELIKAGLHSGASYADWPHAGWPKWFAAPAVKELDTLWQATSGTSTLDRLKTVWEYVDANSGPLPVY